MDTRGADPLRWWMFSQGSPWTSTRTSLGAIDASLRETLATLWNTFSFFTLYASINDFDPHDPEIPAPEHRAPIDQWILSRLESVTVAVTTALDGYEPLGGTDALTELIDDVSNWYVRRTRRRFWRTDPNAPRSDSLAAQATLLDVLQRVTLLLAPFCPFVAERLYAELFDVADDRLGPPDRLATGEPERRDVALEESMAVARRLTSLGRAARAEAGVKVRQPLARALVFLPSLSPTPPAGIVEDELNVDHLEYATDLANVLALRTGAELPHRGSATRRSREGVEARAGGARFGRRGRDPRSRAARISVTLSSGTFELNAEDIELRVKGEEGYAVSRDGGEVIALDLTLTDELRRRGFLRDVIRQVQDLRKNSGLDVADRIVLHVSGIDDLADGFATLASEVLAVEVITGIGLGRGTVLELDDERDARAWVAKGLARDVEFRQRARRVSTRSLSVSRLARLSSRYSRCTFSASSSFAFPASVMATWIARRSLGQFWRSTSPASSMRSTSRVVPPLECTIASAISFIFERPSGERRSCNKTSNQARGSSHSASSSRPRLRDSRAFVSSKSPKSWTFSSPEGQALVC